MYFLIPPYSKKAQPRQFAITDQPAHYSRLFYSDGCAAYQIRKECIINKRFIELLEAQKAIETLYIPGFFTKITISDLAEIALLHEVYHELVSVTQVHDLSIVAAAILNNDSAIKDVESIKVRFMPSFDILTMQEEVLRKDLCIGWDKKDKYEYPLFEIFKRFPTLDERHRFISQYLEMQTRNTVHETNQQIENFTYSTKVYKELLGNNTVRFLRLIRNAFIHNYVFDFDQIGKSYFRKPVKWRDKEITFSDDGKRLHPAFFSTFNALDINYDIQDVIKILIRNFPEVNF